MKKIKTMSNKMTEILDDDEWSPSINSKKWVKTGHYYKYKN